MKERLSFHLEAVLPNLVPGQYKVTSKKDKKYNCAAWAVEEGLQTWIEPRTGAGLSWPDGIPFDYSIESYVQMFEHYGFERCAGWNHEDGFLKVAIFSDDSVEFSHASREQEDGSWTSKLGPDEDIRHDKLSAVVSNDYGLPVAYLKKPTQHAETPKS